MQNTPAGRLSVMILSVSGPNDCKKETVCCDYNTLMRKLVHVRRHTHTRTHTCTHTRTHARTHARTHTHTTGTDQVTANSKQNVEKRGSGNGQLENPTRPEPEFFKKCTTLYNLAHTHVHVHVHATQLVNLAGFFQHMSFLQDTHG